MSVDFATIDELDHALREASYLPDRGLAASLFLALKLEQPLLLEGGAGAGRAAAPPPEPPPGAPRRPQGPLLQGGPRPPRPRAQRAKPGGGRAEPSGAPRRAG